MNLGHFLDDLGLREKQYSGDFPNQAETQFSGDGISIPGRLAQHIISAGAVLEDANWRFFHHFYDPVNDRGLDIDIMPTQPAAPDWGLNGAGETNLRSWNSALSYFDLGMTDPDPLRRQHAQELMFVSLGHVIHLVQDCLQPSHCRNDSHSNVAVFPDGSSALEIWGGRRVTPNGIVGDVALAVPLELTTYYPSYAEYFEDAATFANGRFFSDDTIFEDYANPSQANTGFRTDTIDGDEYEFVTSDDLNDPLTGADARLARINRGLIWDTTTLESPRNVVVLDNAQLLVPRAVARSAGLIEHFFRGRILVSLDDNDPPQLEVTNVSDESVVGDGAHVAFTGGEIRAYYEAVEGTLHLIPFTPFSLGGGLAQGDAVSIPGNILAYLDSVSDPALPPNVRAREDKRVVTLYRGTIGNEEGIAARRASFVQDVSLLLSFDRSGSMSTSELAQAKTAALTLFPFLENGDQNRIAIHAFSTSASVVLDFTDDWDAAAAAIQGLTPGGSTALYDAIVLAGQEASIEAIQGGSTNPDQKTIVILFTDGLRNNSSSSLAQAVAAISSVTHPEITEVFLVFVGDSPTGADSLSDLAAQAGRAFFGITEFSDLTLLFLNLIQGGAD